MIFTDHLVLDAHAPRRTSDGYLAVRAKAARVGVYQYTGREVDPDNAHGLRDQASVNVLRDEAAVFEPRAVRSFIGKPITNGHPTEAVNSGNWKQHSDGVVMGAIRDGDHLAFDLLLMDGAAIAEVEQAIADEKAGKAPTGSVQLSNGYGASLQFGDFVAADGTKCPVRQDAITGNHVARVPAGRAGPEYRIGDAAICDALPQPIFDSLTTQEKPVKTMLIDGLTVDVSNADTAVATITTLVAARDAATGKVTGLESQVAALTTDKATLEGKVKDLTDAKPTPAQLRDAAKAYALVVDKAKANGVAVTDAMDEAAIIKATVLKHLGTMADSAKEWTDAQFASSFAMLKDANTVVPLGAPIVIGDAAAREQKAFNDANDHNAWRTAGKAA